MKKIGALLLLSLGITLFGNKELDSRFINDNDPHVNRVADISLHPLWWSRPYEYAWAGQFTGEGLVVLDAGCGISHPFKWHLVETCGEVWALDLDSRIESKEAILQETRRDLGTEALRVLYKNWEWLDQVNFVKGSIAELPVECPKFDRIFCISVLEKLEKSEWGIALEQFSKHLAADGLIILSMDHPDIDPTLLLSIAKNVGLIPAGTFENEGSENPLSNNGLKVFRCVLKKTEIN